MMECIRVHGVKNSGERMRPGTNTPDKHWAYILVGAYDNSEHIEVIHTDDGIELRIDRYLFQETAQGFEFLMAFVKSNDLAITVDHEQCRRCQGHEACVSTAWKAGKIKR